MALISPTIVCRYAHAKLLTAWVQMLHSPTGGIKHVSYPTSLRLTVTESGDVAKLLIMTTDAALRSASSNAVTSMSPRGHSACMDEHQGIADCGQSCHLRRLGNTELHQSRQGRSPGAVDSPTCKGLAPGQRLMVAGGRLPQGLLRAGPWRKAR
jgi:hypothetical protein